MNKQIVAEKLENSILNRVRGLLVLLQKTLTNENAGMFVTVCERIVKITSDAFLEAEALGCRDFFSGWRRILAPFWKISYVWEYAYGEGFTWKDFIDCIIKDGCTNVTVNANQNIPVVLFSDSNNVAQFYIELGKED